MPADSAARLLTAPPDTADLPRVPLSRDFLLYLLRDRQKVSWATLLRQPRWRTERDMAYLQLEALAGAWHAQQAEAARQDQDYQAMQQRGRAALGKTG